MTIQSTPPSRQRWDELREQMAAIEHEQWAYWTKHMMLNDTSENRERWNRQIATPYSALTEKEKDLDRKWVDKIILLLLSHNQRLVEAILDDLWEKAQSDSKGFGKAYSYLVTKYKPAAVKALIENNN